MISNEETDREQPQESEGEGFEANIQRLEAIVSKLEDGNLPLDESLQLYEEGIEAYRTCHKILSNAETKVSKLVETLEGELQEKPLDVSED
ncbi:MAG: exodeoxyribonuclease VII small subunit [Planctomycetes bacterium]|nr:exodeoxyribonuclease VII small subunit [Planctomycetota bacterium]